ncbi:MAG: hypothetical protein JWO57_1167 [Pseudonocardiales bacterium]|nr:hypothetical protein [Pseudonocardiales bacterium]
MSALAQPATAQQPLNGHSVTVSTLSVTPSTPVPSEQPAPLTVVLQLTNTTDQSLPSVTIGADRGNPINTQTALDNAIKNPQPPDPSLVRRITTKKPVTTSLGPRGTAVVEFRTSSELPVDQGVCVCHDAIYPLYFTVHSAGADGSDTTIGAGQTYVPAFKDKPAPVQVSWVWPIVDRPHRLTSDTVFTDEELAASIAGGRLDRVLAVVEKVGRTVPMTLVIDPELIDELAVMSDGYRVEHAGKVVTGSGSAAARAWLARLRAILDAAPNLQLAFTPPSDPDVESLTRNGLGWTSALSQPAQTRVTAALGGRAPENDIAWPADEALSDDTLTALVRQGTHTVILNDSALPSGSNQSPSANALGAVQTPAGVAYAAVTSRSIQRYVAPVLSVGGTGLAQLPQLVSEVAIRAAEDITTSRFVVIAPPREIDPSVDVAARAISDTARAYWATPLTLGQAVGGTVQPADHGQLVPPGGAAAALSPLTITAAQNLSRVVPALKTMLVNPADATDLLGSLPTAVQRAESSAWRTDHATGDAFASRLNDAITSIESAVRIVKPSTGTYTLASSNSPLPITVENRLSVPVVVRIRVSAAGGLPGFTATDIGLQRIEPGIKVPLHIPTHVERTGRFLVQAVLMTPSGEPVGAPVSLSVHSTALGTIGVIITVVAGAVLALALLIRFARRWRGRQKVGAVAEVVDDPVAVP